MIKAPKWCSNAVPVRAGWKDPVTGEILKVQNFSEAHIAEWHASKNPAPVVKEPEPEPYIFEVKDSEED
jgi:hypothetical protein